MIVLHRCRALHLRHTPTTDVVRLRHVNAHQDAIGLPRCLEYRSALAAIEQGGRCGQRRRQVRNSLDHYAIRQQGAGNGSDLVAGGQSGVCGLVPLGEFRTVNRQP
ncbi:hypothetical protein [Hyphomicrobium denitrificans]|uniref:hypothetical protein n=1 Tax=Hyphomicrobium denitrificans TaxID=53399 RepID=UPI00191C4D3B|nr:hypothetical protein [Hyphomicrobium denitrificans]